MVMVRQRRNEEQVRETGDLLRIKRHIWGGSGSVDKMSRSIWERLLQK